MQEPKRAHPRPQPQPQPRPVLARTLLAHVVPAGLVLAAAAAPPAFASAAIRFETLPNGLEVLLLPEPGREVAAVEIDYRVGTPEEDLETAGFAHLLEHLMGTGTAATPDFQSAIRALGGRVSAQTEEILTRFSTEVPAANVEAVLALEADRMRGLKIDRAAVSRSLDEMRREAAAGPPLAERFLAVVRAAAFPGHFFGRSAATTVPEGVTPDHSRAFYDLFYGPDRACVVVAGGIDPDAVLATIRSSFGPLQATGNPRPPLPGAPPLAAEPVEAVNTAGLVWVGLGYRIPGEATAPGVAAKLLASYLSIEVADSLTAALEAGGRPAPAGVAVEQVAVADLGLLAVMAWFEPGPGGRPAAADARTAARHLAGAVARLAAAPVDPETFETTRDLARLELALARRTAAQRAHELARAHLELGDRALYERLDSTLGSLEPGAWAAMAAMYLAPERAVTVLGGGPAGFGAPNDRAGGGGR